MTLASERRKAPKSGNFLPFHALDKQEGFTADQWIAGVLCFQKMYGLYGLKHHIVEMSPIRDRRKTREDRATQLLICEKLSLAILIL